VFVVLIYYIRLFYTYANKVSVENNLAVFLMWTNFTKVFTQSCHVDTHCLLPGP